MATVMLLIGGGLFFALFVFFVCEEKSLKDSKLSDMKCLITKEMPISQCFEQFQTIKFLGIYFLIMVIFDLVIANVVFVPRGLGLLEILSYTFIPSIIGSGLILLVKWTFQPIIKLVSSFMYGAIFMAASALAFSLSYLAAM